MKSVSSKIKNFVFFITIILVSFILISEYRVKWKGNIVLNGVLTEGEVYNIKIDKKGKKAIFKFYDEGKEECRIGWKRFGRLGDDEIFIGDRYKIYYLSGWDYLMFIDSPLLRVRNNELFINDGFYNGSNVQEICPSKNN